MATALALAVWALGCGGKSSKEMKTVAPPPAMAPPVSVGGNPASVPAPGQLSACPVMKGQYHCEFKTSCGSTGWIWVKAEQNGCELTLTFPLLGVMKGTLQGESAVTTMVFSSPCVGSATGSLTASGETIAGSFIGAASGTDARCCAQINGTFSMKKTE
jgi:hypothetical protein